MFNNKSAFHGSKRRSFFGFSPTKMIDEALNNKPISIIDSNDSMTSTNMLTARTKKARRSMILDIVTAIQNEEKDPANGRIRFGMKTKTIFPIRTEDEEKIRMLDLVERKNIKQALPVLKTSSAVTNFLIHDYKATAVTNEFIKETNKKEKIADKFYNLRKKALKRRSVLIGEKFEKLKNNTILNTGDAAFNNQLDVNYRKKSGTHHSSSKGLVFVPMPRIKKNLLDEDHKPRRPSSMSRKRLMLKEAMYRQSQLDYNIATKEREKAFNKKIQMQAKNLANKILNFDREGETDYVELSKKIKDPLVLEGELNDMITLRKIMRKRNAPVDIDEDLDISDEHVEEEQEEIRYKLVKNMNRMGTKGLPKYLKSTFSHRTLYQFRGSNGQFFGVAC